MGLKSIKRNFRFLNYHWGKAIFSAFIACASLSNAKNQILQYVNAALFIVLTVMLIVMAVIDRQTDIDRSLKDDAEQELWKEKQAFKENPSLHYVLHKQGRKAKDAYSKISKTVGRINQFSNAIEGPVPGKHGGGVGKGDSYHLEEDYSGGDNNSMATPNLDYRANKRLY